MDSLVALDLPDLKAQLYKDFWRIIPASHNYCVICFKLSSEQMYEVPRLLRRVLSLPELSTKRARMGCVISVSHRSIEMYRA